MVEEERVIGIYRITCKATGKIYIGQSTKIESRWNQHKRGRFPASLFYYTIEQECCIGMLDLLERYFIMKYRSISPFGFNEQVNSYNQFRRSSVQEKKKKTLSDIAKSQWQNDRERMVMSMSDRKKPPPFSEEHRLRMSQSRTGKKFSEETKAKLSAAAKNRSKKRK